MFKPLEPHKCMGCYVRGIYNENFAAENSQCSGLINSIAWKIVSILKQKTDMALYNITYSSSGMKLSVPSSGKSSSLKEASGNKRIY